MKNKLAKLLPALTLVLTAPTFINIANAQQPKESGALTAEQKVKLQNICQTHQQQLRAVLTPAEYAQLQKENAYGYSSRRGKRESLKLTSEQETKIKQIRSSGFSQMNEILTPEQHQLEEKLSFMRNNQGAILKEGELGPLFSCELIGTTTGDFSTSKPIQKSPPLESQKQAESGLNLTADQQVKLQNVCQTHQKQLSAVLTPEQQAQIQADIPDPWTRNNGRQKPLNLTSAQQAKMDRIRDTGRSQMNDILTPKQQQQQKDKQQQQQQQQQAEEEFRQRYGDVGATSIRRENYEFRCHPIGNI